jgi:hypothetical protein
VGIARRIEDKPDNTNETRNGAAAKSNDAEKSVGNGDFMPIGDQSMLNEYELSLIQKAEEQPLTNSIFKGTYFETNCKVISHDFGISNDLGDYSSETKTIRINHIFENSLKRGMCKIRNNIEYFTEDEILVLDTYAHEWVHSKSNKTIFDDERQLLKEILTEYVARSLVHERTKIMGFGGYDKEIDLFLLYKKPTVNSANTMMHLKSESLENISETFKSLLADESKIDDILNASKLTVLPNKMD